MHHIDSLEADGSAKYICESITSLLAVMPSAAAIEGILSVATSE
jgi:hypothetical protein